MSSTRRVALSLALAMAAGAAWAQGGRATSYPTVGRIEFVLKWMQKNGGKQEFLYKCACLVDEIAQTYTYDDFVEASTAARYQSLAGERGGVFRDPPQVRETAKRYLQIQGDAMKHCGVTR